jgi:2'-5' RNA ligase
MAFLGIRAPHEAGRLLSQLDVPGEKTSVSEMHITLLYFGDEWPVSEISKSLEATYEVTSKTQPFLVKMEKATHFSKSPEDKYPVITRVESEDLHKMRNELSKKFDKEKIEFSKLYKDFKPHVTLSYSEEEPDDIEFHPVEFVVQEIVLWGGDHGDDRIFVTFPLASPAFDKNALLIKKVEVFEKLAGNPLQDFLTPSHERRKLNRHS